MEAKIFPIAPVSSSAATGLILAVLLVLGLVFTMFGYLLYSIKHCRFEINSSGIQVVGDIYSRTIPFSTIKLEEIKMLDLASDANSPYKPVFRTNGAALPGYLSGWFRLANKEKALLYMSDKSKVVYIPTTSGFSVLLSPDDPQEFVKVLKETSPQK